MRDLLSSTENRWRVRTGRSETPFEFARHPWRIELPAKLHESTGNRLSRVSKFIDIRCSPWGRKKRRIAGKFRRFVERCCRAYGIGTSRISFRWDSRSRWQQRALVQGVPSAHAEFVKLVELPAAIRHAAEEEELVPSGQQGAESRSRSEWWHDRSRIRPCFEALSHSRETSPDPDKAGRRSNHAVNAPG